MSGRFHVEGLVMVLGDGAGRARGGMAKRMKALANEYYYRLLLHSSRVLGASSYCLRKSIFTNPWLKPGADGILP